MASSVHEDVAQHVVDMDNLFMRVCCVCVCMCICCQERERERDCVLCIVSVVVASLCLCHSLDVLKFLMFR